MGENDEEAGAHLWVVLGCGEVLGGCGSTEQGGGGGGSTAARVLRWVLGEEKLPVSCAGVRRSDW